MARNNSSTTPSITRRIGNAALSLSLAASLSPLCAEIALANQEDDSFPLQGAATVDESLEADGIIVAMEGGILSKLSLLGESTEEQLEDAGLDLMGEAESAEGLTLLQAQPEAGMSLQEAVNAAAGIDGVAYAQPNYLLDLIRPLAEEDESGANEESGTDEGSGEGSNGEDGAGAGSDSGVDSGTTPDPEPDRPAIDPTTSLSGTNDPIAQGDTLSSDRSGHRDQYWAYNAGLVEAWKLADVKEPVTIAVFDSGAMLAHEDLSANVLTNLAYDAFADISSDATDVFSPNGVNDKSSNGHGTHVSGIAGATTNNGAGISGAARNAATILPVNVVNDSAKQGASVLSIIRAYNYVFDLVEAEACNVRVINLSAGGYTESDNFIMLKALIEKARADYGIVTVCAGGNSNKSETLYPGDYEACVSVTALNSDGTDWILSDHNKNKDISAPGQLICSTIPYIADADNDSISLAADVEALPEELDRYGYLSGTSMASPIVAGTVALMFATVPDATVDEVLDALYATATEIPEFDEECGTAGAVDAGAALDYLIELTTELEPFPDVDKDDWFYEAVVFANDNGIMTGYSTGKLKGYFGPSDTLKRSETAQILYNCYGNEAIVPSCDLPDVGEDWYTKAINWCVQEGIMTGYDSGPKAGTFGINDPLTREQAALIIARVAEADVALADSAKFEALEGHEETSPWAKEALIWAVDQGVFNGEEGKLYPKRNIKRSEMAKVMMNSLTGGIIPALPDFDEESGADGSAS